MAVIVGGECIFNLFCCFIGDWLLFTCNSKVDGFILWRVWQNGILEILEWSVNEVDNCGAGGGGDDDDVLLLLIDDELWNLAILNDVKDVVQHSKGP